VLVCLLVLALIAAGLLRMVHLQRGVLRTEERRLQADWLVESGLERAAARLADDAAYPGESWTLSARELEGPAPGVVTIAVEPGPGPAAAGSRLVTVVADYPGDPRQRVRSRKQAVVDVGPGGRSGAGAGGAMP
jgi:hypothetical protein